MADRLVPDLSVLNEGVLKAWLDAAGEDATVLVPRDVLALLERQARDGRQTGRAGLDELAEIGSQYKVRLTGQVPHGAYALENIAQRVRETAREENATLITTDRVQLLAAKAEGLDVIDATDTPTTTNWCELDVAKHLEDDVMSVHLRAGDPAMVKRGTPGAIVYEAASDDILHAAQLERMVLQCAEAAKRSEEGFLEMSKKGATVMQIGPMRITVAEPPFSDAMEITVVRPVVRLSITDYDLPAQVLERLEDGKRGILVAGSPGSGKSTLVAAVGQHLHELQRVVKTMEQPRDLQVPRSVTQYGALDGDMRWTGELLLLVRPDHVLYDEVRTTEDFRTYADMRLAGVGLIGVTHANRAIDAVQRMIGRVELGMIPQVCDTIVFVEAGRVGQILELESTVRVPTGMGDSDLARPVVVVRDFISREDVFELYTFGEQVVVMPLAAAAKADAARASVAKGLEMELKRAIRRAAGGVVDVVVHGKKAEVRAESWDIPNIIGRGGKTIGQLERRFGVRIDVKPRKGGAPGPKTEPSEPMISQVGSNVFVSVDAQLAGQTMDVLVGGAHIGSATVNQLGRMRFKAKSTEGQLLREAKRKNMALEVQASEIQFE